MEDARGIVQRFWRRRLDEIEEIAEGLYEWLNRHGNPPHITGNKELDRLMAFKTCESILAWDVVV